MSFSPAPEAEADRPFRAGWSLSRDILVAPKRAFATILARGSWIPPFTVIVVLGLVSGFLEWPALTHVLDKVPVSPTAKTTHGVTVTFASSQAVLASLLLEEAITPLLFIGLTATVLTGIARFKASTIRYGAFLALAAACLIPSAIGELLGAIVVRAHDPAGYHDYRSIALAIPDNLGVFAAKGNDRELAFLARFGIFDIWSYTLLAFGFAALVPVRFTTAVAVAFSLDFVLSLLN